jgi:hypothetical protein
MKFSEYNFNLMFLVKSYSREVNCMQIFAINLTVSSLVCKTFLIELLVYNFFYVCSLLEQGIAEDIFYCSGKNIDNLAV